MKLTLKSVKHALSYLNIAKEISTFSEAQRRKVGAVIVSSSGRIIGTGYNGTPSGVDNCCELDDVTHEYVIHAELNAIFNATTHDLTGSTLYLTDSPCIKCASAILQKGFAAVIYLQKYRIEDGIHFLKNNNVTVYSYDDLIHMTKTPMSESLLHVKNTIAFGYNDDCYDAMLQKIVEHAKKSGKISADEISMLVNVTYADAIEYMNRLDALGILNNDENLGNYAIQRKVVNN